MRAARIPGGMPAAAEVRVTSELMSNAPESAS